MVQADQELLLFIQNQLAVYCLSCVKREKATNKLAIKHERNMNMDNRIEKMLERRSKIIAGGGEKRIVKQHESGKMTARERINELLDDKSFVEIDTFVTHNCTNFGMGKVDAPAEGVITGCGTIDGRLVYVYA